MRAHIFLILCSSVVGSCDAEGFSKVLPSPSNLYTCLLSQNESWNLSTPGNYPQCALSDAEETRPNTHNVLRQHQGPPAWEGNLHHFVPTVSPFTQSDRSLLRNGHNHASGCGQPAMPMTAHARIMGGAEAQAGSFPWQVLLRVNGRAAGALVADRWILTVAHILRPKMAPREWAQDTRQQVWAYLGDTDVKKMVQLGSHEVEHVVVHPGYKDDANDFRHDIALIKLKYPVVYDKNISPICLPKPENIAFYAPGRLGYVSGHGEIGKQRLLNKLRYIQLPVVDPDTCATSVKNKTIYDLPTIVDQHMFCAGYPEGGRDACMGDSGGAFVVFDKEREAWVVTGLVSWSIGCGMPNQYGFYTKVASYVVWINRVLSSH
ncbi:complement C1r subcomponent-like [Pleurodeles waltl]|uniref:complement C1r subcomponent-like n=1 Tax=Pleurodeles waltl TaxID=8319 RepID=UPI0037099BA6